MSIEQRITALLDDAVPEPPRSLNADDIRDRATRHSRRRFVAPALAAAVVAAIAVTVVAVNAASHDGRSTAVSSVVSVVSVVQSSRPSALPSSLPTEVPIGPLVPTDIGGITFAHPAKWRTVQSEGVSLGPSSIVGYLTDQPTVAQCSTSPTYPTGGYSITCGPPVYVLKPGGVLIIFRAEELSPKTTTSPNATVAELPAEVTDDPGPCPRYTVATIDALILETAGVRGSPGSALDITACLGGPDPAAARAEFQRMLATAHK